MMCRGGYGGGMGGMGGGMRGGMDRIGGVRGPGGLSPQDVVSAAMEVWGCSPEEATQSLQGYFMDGRLVEQGGRILIGRSLERGGRSPGGRDRGYPSFDGGQF